MAPEGWSSRKFSDVTEIANGQVDPKAEPYSEMLHLGPENIESGTGQIRACKTSKQLGLISGKYEFNGEAIVYSKIRPNLNKVCKPGFNGVCSADMYPIWAKNGLDIDYLYHYMLSPGFYRKAVAMSMRTGMPKINRSDLNAIRMPLPPLTEQRKIARILSTWDKAIATTEQLLSNSKQQKKSLMQQLLTGKKRLPGFKDKRWKEHTLGSLFSERKESGALGLPLLSVTSNNGIINRDDVGRKDTSSADKSKYIRVYPGDIAYNTMRMWQGVSALSSMDGIVSPAYTVLTPKSGVKSRYAAYLFKLPIMIHQFYRHSQGLVSDTWNLKYKHFSKIKVAVPETNEQMAIADILSKEDESIRALQRQIEQLRQEKRALMQQLLTGKRRVRTSSAE